MKLLIATLAKNNPDEVYRTYRSTEHIAGADNIIFDGGSRDDVLAIYNRLRLKVMSKSDSGIYEGMNNALSYFFCNLNYTHIMFLNSGDTFTTSQDILRNIEEGISYSFLVKSQKYIHSNFGAYDPQRMSLPHPGLVLSRIHAKKIGMFDLRYKSAADLDFINRINFSIKKSSVVIVTMAAPGSSSKLLSRWESYLIALKYGKKVSKSTIDFLKDIMAKIFLL